MLFQSNPFLYQAQSNYYQHQPTAEHLNALYSNKMDSFHFNFISHTNLLNCLHRMRVTPQQVIQCKYYMEALKYYNCMQFSNALCTPLNQLSPCPYTYPYPYLSDVSSTTTPHSGTVTPPKEEEEDISQGIELLEEFKEFYPFKRIGVYDWKTRVMKIIRYKIKRIKKQAKKPVVTKYSGRSKVASLKTRYRGRFVRNDKLKESMKND